VEHKLLSLVCTNKKYKTENMDALLQNPLVQSAAIAVSVYFALTTLKPSFMYDINGVLKPGSMLSPMTAALAAGAAWAAYQHFVKGNSITDALSGGGLRGQLSPTRRFAQNFGSIPQAPPLVGDTFS
jgi:hypothetical protein